MIEGLFSCNPWNYSLCKHQATLHHPSQHRAKSILSTLSSVADKMWPQGYWYSENPFIFCRERRTSLAGLAITSQLPHRSLIWRQAFDCCCTGINGQVLLCSSIAISASVAVRTIFKKDHQDCIELKGHTTAEQHSQPPLWFNSGVKCRSGNFQTFPSSMWQNNSSCAQLWT